jgi:hypothetical protein
MAVSFTVSCAAFLSSLFSASLAASLTASFAILQAAFSSFI